MEEQKIPQEEGSFTLQDFMNLCRRFWEKRRFIVYVVGGFMAFGLLAAICQRPIYTASTVFVPQSSSKSASSSSLSSLAAMAGVSLGDMTTGASLSPLIYPQMLSNINLNKELMATKLHFKKFDEPVSILDYYTNKKYRHGFNPLGIIKKYTIGLPGVILGAIKGKPKEIAMPVTGAGDTVAVFTQNEYKVYKDVISKAISMTVDKKEGYITLTATMGEDIASAELCQAAYNLLEKYITDFKIQYARKNNDYIRGRYEEAKADYESKQLALAQFTDSNRGLMTATAQTRKEKLTSDYQLSYAIFTELSKQLLQSDMKVKEDTAVLASVEPVSVPMKKNNSRAKVLIVWTFLGLCCAFGGVWGFDYLKKQGINFPKNWN